MPKSTPNTVPTTPIRDPCTRKIRAISRGPAPSVRSMAMSERLSFTAMTSEDSRLKAATATIRSEEHTSELQSLMRISYAVFCLKKKNKKNIYNEISYIQNIHTQQKHENT